jgi:hypothetical protein
MKKTLEYLFEGNTLSRGRSKTKPAGGWDGNAQRSRICILPYSFKMRPYHF